MPRYSFHTTVGSAPARDDGAFDLDDIDAARAKAEAIRAAEARATPRVDVVVEVRDEAREQVYTLLQLT